MPQAYAYVIAVPTPFTVDHDADPDLHRVLLLATAGTARACP
jgi:hypothetical protein